MRARVEKDATYLDIHSALLIPIPIEGMRVFLGGLARALGDGYALPPELLDRDERLLQVRVPAQDEGAYVERERLGLEDEGRGLREVCVIERRSMLCT